MEKFMSSKSFNSDSERYMNMIKALLPYMPNSRRHQLSSILKIAEIQNAIHQFDYEQEELLSSCSTRNSPPNPTDIIGAIKDFCSDSEKETLDMFSNFLQAFQLVREYNSTSANNNNAKSSEKFTNPNPLDIVRNMLTPEQQTMMDLFKN